MAATDRCLLLKLSRDDIQTERDEDEDSMSDEDEDPALDENFEPSNVGALRRMSRAPSIAEDAALQNLPQDLPGATDDLVEPASSSAPDPDAEKAAATRRRASTTLLGSLAPACPREATIHVTLERGARKFRGSVSGPAGKGKKQTMSKKKMTIKNAQAKDKAVNG